MGQWGMLFPEKDMVVSIMQTIKSPEVDAIVRKAIFDFVASVQDSPVAWTQEETDSFLHRLSAMTIPAPVYMPDRHLLTSLDGKTLKITDGEAHFLADDL